MTEWRAKTLWVIVAMAWISFASQVSAAAEPRSSPADVVRNELSVPDGQLNYARAKLAFDRIIDASLDAEAVSAEIDRLARSATALAGNNPTPAARLGGARMGAAPLARWTPIPNLYK